MITYHIISVFPEAFASYLDSSILARAIRGKLIAVKIYNLRDFTTDKHRKIDDRPYGGGPGMVIHAMPIIKAVEKIKEEISIRERYKYQESAERGRGKVKSKKGGKTKVILFSAQGKRFTNEIARKVSKYNDVILICGHYEGIDARVTKILSAQGGSASSGKAEEVSIGPYILTGGELPAMILIDSISRQVTGVLGKHESLEEGRIASPKVYTRPEVLEYKGKKYRVPKVMLSGDHKKIEEYKRMLKSKG